MCVIVILEMDTTLQTNSTVILHSATCFFKKRKAQSGIKNSVNHQFLIWQEVDSGPLNFHN